MSTCSTWAVASEHWFNQSYPRARGTMNTIQRDQIVSQLRRFWLNLREVTDPETQASLEMLGEIVQSLAGIVETNQYTGELPKPIDRI